MTASHQTMKTMDRKTAAGQCPRQLAVLTLQRKDGSVHHRQLLQLAADGSMISHSPLTEEVAFCEWYRGVWCE